MSIFKKKKQYINIPIPSSAPVPGNAPSVPDGVFIKCAHCGKTVYGKALTVYKVCPECRGLFRLSARERIGITADAGTFAERDAGLSSKNPMSYPGYGEKIIQTQEKTGMRDAVITGACEIGGLKTVLCVMDSNFIMASMGSVVGEKITRAFEYATENKLPAVVFTASGGARMQEGIVSLMQMAKTSAAAKRHSDAGLFYLTVLTDPTTGGVTASFAMLGDIIIAEPKALVGFAGRRVIEQTIKQSLPEGFQSAEFLLRHGFIDKIVERSEMKGTIAGLLRLHSAHKAAEVKSGSKGGVE